MTRERPCCVYGKGEEPWHSHGKPNGSRTLERGAGSACQSGAELLCDLPSEEIAVTLVVGLADDLRATQEHGSAAQGVFLMIKEKGRVDALPTIEHLEMEVVTSSVARSTSKSNHLSCLDMLTGVYEVDRLMAIERLNAVGVFHHDAVAITGNWARLLDDAVKGYVDTVVRCVCLDVHACMMIGGCGVGFLTQFVIGAGDVAADERIAPVHGIEKLQVDLRGSGSTKVLRFNRIEG